MSSINGMASPSYYMRPVLASDLTAVTILSSHAFLDDEVFTLIWSQKGRDPRVFPAWREWNLLHNKMDFIQKGAQYWVMCYRAPVEQGNGEARPPVQDTSAAQLGEEHVVAAAIWHRHGLSNTAKAWQQNHSSWYHALERQLLEWEYAAAELQGAFGTAYNRRLNAAFDKMCGDAADRWESTYPERWHLSFMAVDSAHRRRGLGQRLMQWGLDNARAEGVPASLFASFSGREMYYKQGFRVIDWPNCDLVIHDNSRVSPYMLWEADKYQDDCHLEAHL